ncbi:MAG: hypothetical protein RL702_1265 [Pseudomonadota bacterium]|nr:hypothetical protein [Novosphingobium sp.]HPZ47863.1 hypothetical protein [Novosphingobium sp.]HQE00404.1 hypothetical protein [Novosphingobium sp.]
MNARIGSGWQTLMADLSMVLFMISAAAVGDAPAPPAAPPLKAALPALGDPVAVWRGTDPAALRAWLDGQGSDPRQRLTIVAPQPSAQAALTLAAGAGRPARVLIEPQRAGQPYAALTFDQDPALARPLLNQSGNPQEPQP